jgi:acetylornithine deacetylase/succinyl-diaminopimelate desuccinylase-like protein
MSGPRTGDRLVEALRPAFGFVDARRAKTTAQQIAICEVAAPTFHEEHRARLVRKLLRSSSVSHIHSDEVGNVLALRKGIVGGRCIVVAAHLDTVFPPDVVPKVVRSGSHGQVLKAPGIADNAGGVAAMLAIAEALDRARIRTRDDVLFVGTACEEALGNLRGVRHLLRNASFRRQVAGLIAIDGSNSRKLVTSGPAIRRYRVTFRSRGGHSWGRFGTPSPIHAAGRLIARLASMRVPVRPTTTFTVGVVSDGDAATARAGVIVTAVATSAAIEVDLRSETARSLWRLERAFRSALDRALGNERRFAARDAESLRARVECIGDRPAGRTPRTARIVRAAIESYAQFGFPLECVCASTDATCAMSLGIPAVTIPQGGRGHRTHTLEERISVVGRERAIKAGLLLVVRLAGLA